MECLELILNHLNHDDLISISILCKDFLKFSNTRVKSVQVTNGDMLSRYLKRFRQMESICFNNFEGDIDDAFKELASNSEIKKLRVSDSYQVDYDFTKMANCFPNLEQLEIWGGYSPPRPNILPLYLPEQFKFKLLRKVGFFRFHDLGDFDLLNFASGCPLLEDVSLLFCSKVTEGGVGFILQNSRNLKALWVDSIGKVPDRISGYTIENSIRCNAKALASLKLNHLNVSDKDVEAISKAKLPLKEFALVQFPECSVSALSKVLRSSKDLRKLRIATCDANMKFLFMDGVGENITHIDIQDSPDTTMATLSLLLTECPSLVDLRMHLNAAEAVDFSSSKQYHNIRILSFLFGYEFEFCDAFVIQMGQSFPNLQILELLRCNEPIEAATSRRIIYEAKRGGIEAVTSSDVEAMFRCCRSITSRGIEAVLRCCRSITQLTLGGYGRRILMEADNNSQALNLEVLELIDSDVDDEGFAALAQRCCRLVSLKLSICKNVSTEGIKHIVTNIKTLKCLELSDLPDLDYDHLLEWMLSTNNTASLKRIYILWYNFKDEHRDKFLRQGCFFFSDFN